MIKYMPWLDSPRLASLETILTRFLIAVERGFTGEDDRADFFTVTVWGYLGQPCNNQQSYGQINVTVGFSRSERSRTDLGRSSNCDLRVLYDNGEWRRG
jgi:single-stranded DNA-binding protein